MNAATTAAAIAFEPVRIRRLHEQICGQIRELLATGQLKPGPALDPAQPGCSRLPLRTRRSGCRIKSGMTSFGKWLSLRA